MTFDENVSVTSVSAAIVAFVDRGFGELGVALRADVDGSPGDILKSGIFFLQESPYPYEPEWVEFGGLDWQLNAGTYWISLEPPNGSSTYGYLYGNVPNPLAKYGIWHSGYDWWTEPAQLLYEQWAFQVHGDVVPEPTTHLLLGAGLLALIGISKLRRRTSA